GQDFAPATLCVQAGTQDDPITGAVGTPIYQTSTFHFTAETYEAMRIGKQRDHLLYTRYGNPSQWSVQRKIAALEGAESGLLFSSGMAAISTTLLSLMESGDHMVTTHDVYGGTSGLLINHFPKWGIEASYVELDDLAAVEAAITPKTKLLYFEALTNPLLKYADIKGLAAIARRHGLKLVIDATFLTPIGIQPISLGADLVIHSATKYLNGHSDLCAGVVLGSKELVDMIWGRMIYLGGSLDPHAAFLLERGLKTLHLRMRAHHENALKIARFLEGHPDVNKVIHPLLKSHPNYERASRDLAAMAGGMVTFFVEGGDEVGLTVCHETKVAREATSLGGVETLISMPYNSSHIQLTQEEREAVGIHPGCIRLSVGVEDAQDLIADLDQALMKAHAVAGAR
ncbi:MAG TPA: aminotransferase class I/II-fold pyridoxal phosphate-dependent enzyme, partial [Candidatus Krumholzibacteria bacterium]|nr:aminotransferase class I/II-fold pyridoxal phosphate-dependent enzyme [Candidatus Krumholzibacteria bacterium]